ncbi:hypothetical protein [Nonomuraea sp. KM90]|uniref:hypothetical protein n=1 Tax=Nonomuraea sp. KM90 TaxID=3457428 RepID=UPI003FCE2635
MTNTTAAPATDRMPIAVKTAQYVMTFEVAFGLAGTALMLVVFAPSFEWPLLLPLAYVTALLSAIGWQLSRWRRRRRMLRWEIAAVQVVSMASNLTDAAVYSELTWSKLINPFPLIIIIAMLLPSAGRWFCEPRGKWPLSSPATAPRTPDSAG